MIVLKHKEKPAMGNKRSYIAISGDLRDNIERIALATGRTRQDVGHDLLEQAVNEVLPQLEDKPEYTGPQRAGMTRIRRR